MVTDENDLVKLALAADRLERRLARLLELPLDPRYDPLRYRARCRLAWRKQRLRNPASKHHSLDTIGAFEAKRKNHPSRRFLGGSGETQFVIATPGPDLNCQLRTCVRRMAKREMRPQAARETAPLARWPRSQKSTTGPAI